MSDAVALRPNRRVARQSRPFCMMPMVFAAWLMCAAAGPTAAGASSVKAERFIDAVRTFADRVIEHGRDRYGETHTPLFVNRLNVQTLEPAAKRSNFAIQQNLMRTLVGLTELTGEPEYRAAAEAAAHHMFAHHRSPSGLLYWGGYVYIDLESNTYRGPRNDEHSLRGHMPFYELMWQVDPEATAQFIRAYWNAHVLDWGTLETCRRGGAQSNWDVPMGDLWDNQFDDPGPFIRTERTLAFLHGGTDMIYAAALLSLLADEAEAWTWGERLAKQYVQARHPQTGLGVAQYNVLDAIRELPDDGPLPTLTHYGDRAKNQFATSGSSDPDDAFYNPIKGKTAEDGFPVAREPWKLFSYGPRMIYQTNALVQLHLAERLGDRGERLLEWTVDGLKAYAEHAYDAEADRFRPMWADGTDLTDLKMPRSGYCGDEGDRYRPGVRHHIIFLSYARAWRLTRDEQLWPIVRSLARGLGLGDPGATPGEAAALDLQTDHTRPRTLLAVLEIADAAADREAYLDLAERIGENILDRRFHNGLFASPGDEVAHVDSVDALALLAAAAARLGRADDLPPILPLRGGVLLGG